METKRSITKLYVAGFISNLHFLGAVLTSFFTEWGGLQEGQMFMLQALFMVSSWLFEIPTGFVADKYGRRISVVVGLCVEAIGFYIYAIQPNIWLFALGEITIAFGFALTSGADLALIQDYARETSKDADVASNTADQINRKYRFLRMMALSIGSLMGTQIDQLFGTQYPTRLMAIPLILSALFMLWMHDPSRSNGNVVVDHPKVSIWAGIRQLRQNRALSTIAFDKAIVGSICGMMIWLYQGVLLDLGMDKSRFGVIHAAIVFLEVIIIYKTDLSIRILGSRRKVLYVLSIVPIIGFGCAALAVKLGSGTIAILLGVFAPFLVVGFGLSRDPYFYKAENAGLSNEERATILSTIGMIRQLGMVVIYLLTWVLVDRYKPVVVAGLALVLIVWRWRVKLPDRVNI